MNAYGPRINAWRGLSDYSWMPQKGRETLAELFYHGALKPDEETILFGDVKDQERVRDLITAYPESTRPSIAQAMLRELEQGEIYEPSFWNELERISQNYTENQLREFADNLDRTEDVTYWPVEIAEMAIGQEPEVAEELFNLGRNKSTTYRELENIVR